MKRAFTLIELMVVIGMIAVLIAAMGVSIGKAHTRSKIAKATQEAKEMTNALLAYEQYAKGHTLDDYAKGAWTKCTKGSMAMILGGKEGANGQEIPVLYNANIRGDSLLDPWGHPYEYRIERVNWPGENMSELKTAPVLPNYFRLSDKERQ